MKDNVVVYGSLKRGFGNHSWMNNDAEYVRDVELNIGYKMVSLGAFPGLVPTNDIEKKIKGELYANADVEHLDILEGYPSFYTRVQVKVDDNTTAWIYVLNDSDSYDDCPEVVNGEW